MVWYIVRISITSAYTLRFIWHIWGFDYVLFMDWRDVNSLCKRSTSLDLSRRQTGVILKNYNKKKYEHWWLYVILGASPLDLSRGLHTVYSPPSFLLSTLISLLLCKHADLMCGHICFHICWCHGSGYPESGWWEWWLHACCCCWSLLSPVAHVLV